MLAYAAHIFLGWETVTEIKAELLHLNDERVQSIDNRIELMLADAAAEHGMHIMSVAMCAITLITRQMAYTSIEETAKYLEAMSREIASDYQDKAALNERIAIGNNLTVASDVIAQRVIDELEEARAEGKVS